MSEVIARSLVKAPKKADRVSAYRLAVSAWKGAFWAYYVAFTGKAEPHDLFDLGKRLSLLRSAVIALRG